MLREVSAVSCQVVALYDYNNTGAVVTTVPKAVKPIHVDVNYTY